MKAVPEIVIRLNGKEAKGGVRCPVKPDSIGAARHGGLEDAITAQGPVHGHARARQCLRVSLRRRDDAGRQIMKNVQIFRIAESVFSTIGDRSARDIAFRVAVPCQETSNLSLKVCQGHDPDSSTARSRARSRPANKKPRRPPCARSPLTTMGTRSSVITRSRGQCQKHCV